MWTGLSKRGSQCNESSPSFGHLSGIPLVISELTYVPKLREEEVLFSSLIFLPVFEAEYHRLFWMCRASFVVHNFTVQLTISSHILCLSIGGLNSSRILIPWDLTQTFWLFQTTQMNWIHWNFDKDSSQNPSHRS